MPKVLELIVSCAKCPRRVYSSGNRYDCSLAGAAIPEGVTIAPFCPLPDYPAQKIADMAETIRLLRKGDGNPFILEILSGVAKRLNVLVSDSWGMQVLLKDGSALRLRYDSISEITTYPPVVHFVSESKKYKLHPDASPPEIYEEVMCEGMEQPGWKMCPLA